MWREMRIRMTCVKETVTRSCIGMLTLMIAPTVVSYSSFCDNTTSHCE